MKRKYIERIKQQYIHQTDKGFEQLLSLNEFICSEMFIASDLCVF